MESEKSDKKRKKVKSYYMFWAPLKEPVIN